MKEVMHVQAVVAEFLTERFDLNVLGTGDQEIARQIELNDLL